MKKITLTSLFIMMCLSIAFSQEKEENSISRNFFIGSTFTMLGNLVPGNSPEFVQLNAGYRLTPKDVLSVETKTWKYAWPLGIPYGKSFEAPEEKYPGYVREFGIGIVYQRFLWKGVYASIDAGNMFAKYMDENNELIQNGYTLFMTYRLGYHFQFFNDRFFFEPSIAATHWPIKTNVPDTFSNLESNWPNYFLFEPGLHFGIYF